MRVSILIWYMHNQLTLCASYRHGLSSFILSSSCFCLVWSCSRSVCLRFISPCVLHRDKHSHVSCINQRSCVWIQTCAQSYMNKQSQKVLNKWIMPISLGMRRNGEVTVYHNTYVCVQKKNSLQPQWVLRPACALYYICNFHLKWKFETSRMDAREGAVYIAIKVIMIFCIGYFSVTTTRHFCIIKLTV